MPHKVMLGTPTRHNVHAEYALSLARDVDRGLITHMMIERGVHVEDNRNAIWRSWQKHKHEYLLMVDPDISWGWAAIQTMMSHCNPVAFADMPMSYFKSTAFNWTSEGSGKVEQAPFRAYAHKVDAFASGMVLFHRDILDRIGPDPWSRIDTHAEDVSFCKRLYTFQIRPFCVPGMNVTHWSIPALGLKPRTH